MIGFFNWTPEMADEEKVEEYDHRSLSDWSNVNSTNGTMHLSEDMVFNNGHRLSITVYRWVKTAIPTPLIT